MVYYYLPRKDITAYSDCSSARRVSGFSHDMGKKWKP